MGLPGREEEDGEEAGLGEGALPPRLWEGRQCLSQCARGGLGVVTGSRRVPQPVGPCGG